MKVAWKGVLVTAGSRRMVQSDTMVGVHYVTTSGMSALIQRRTGLDGTAMFELPVAATCTAFSFAAFWYAASSQPFVAVPMGFYPKLHLNPMEWYGPGGRRRGSWLTPANPDAHWYVYGTTAMMLTRNYLEGMLILPDPQTSLNGLEPGRPVVAQVGPLYTLDDGRDKRAEFVIRRIFGKQLLMDYGPVGIFREETK